MINITSDELESFFKRIIETLRTQQYESIELDTDYYWEISTTDWDKFPEGDSGQHHVGSLVDDYESIKKELKSFDDIPIPIVNFDRVAALLRAISQKINPPE